ncbi:Protein of unknown function (DUF1059) [Parafrankia irregularis]|uniref:DUF1059 domain-containing protein n=1 Tax=Parafrankia irregularis TaxID=795642 RepID=A0A0S4R1Q7_9ACTN|nr:MULTISPECIES: DUF1059 domain-containing protein [Parafrankia]MBE3206763.1 DUF1059 domain-containing protein [Parafrankia sp. CH37]CUU60838.1 Protein of unknown function (DUF1059) [Parafrankia irregularis]
MASCTCTDCGLTLKAPTDAALAQAQATHAQVVHGSLTRSTARGNGGTGRR